MALNGLYFFNDLDMWTTYGMGVESGSDDFLKIPARKESIKHKWLDDDGEDIDLSHTFFEAREVTLKCFMLHNTKADFISKYNGLIALFRTGNIKVTITRHQKDYWVYYKSNSSFQSYNYRIAQQGILSFKFNLTLVEPKPVFV